MVNETPPQRLRRLRGLVIFSTRQWPCHMPGGRRWRQLNPVDTRKHWLSPEIPLDSPPRRAVFPSESKGKFISSLFLSVVLSLLRPQLRSRMRDQSRPRVKFFQATGLNVMKKTQQSLIPSRLIPALFFFSKSLDKGTS